MRTAAAFEPGEAVADFAVRGMRRRLKQRRRGHDPAIDAIAALRDLLVDISLLQGVRMLRRPEAGERGNPGPARRRYRGHARARGDAVQMHGAGAALGETAAEMRI